ncbi:MAG: PilZ domain-containing protein [Sphingopyxis sp.]|nr:PilZ domain-containing protein [Sphingopyxis sp.]
MIVRSLLAHIAIPADDANRRRMERRTLRLDVDARSADTESAVVIRNLSRTGLLIETDAAFAVGETFILILPELGAAPARVVRNDGKRFGCEFLSPVPASAISAAMLKGAYNDDVDEAGEALAGVDLGEVGEPLRSNPYLFAMLTILFTAAVLLFIIALTSLNFS